MKTKAPAETTLHRRKELGLRSTLAGRLEFWTIASDARQRSAKVVCGSTPRCPISSSVSWMRRRTRPSDLGNRQGKATFSKLRILKDIL